MVTRGTLLRDALRRAVSSPGLRLWQARRVAYSYAAQQQRPAYKVVKVKRLSNVRVAVTGEETGYLFPEDGPDVTVTLVERRNYQFWLKDPFLRSWVRWL